MSLHMHITTTELPHNQAICGRQRKKPYRNQNSRWWVIFGCKRCINVMIATHNRVTEEHGEMAERLAAVVRAVRR